MSGIKIIPVYGNKDSIIKSLEQNNLSEGIAVIPPIQFILEGNTTFTCEKEKVSQLNNDICFLQLSQSINSEEEKVLLNAIKAKRAPIEFMSNEEVEQSILKQENNNSENTIIDRTKSTKLTKEENELFENIKEYLEEDSVGEVSINDLNRLEDTTLKMANSNNESIVLTSHNSATATMIPEGYKEAIFICNTVVIDENGEVVYYTEKEPEVIFKVVKFSINPENSTASVDENGSFLISSDARFTYAIENFAPAAVTVLTLDADHDYQIAQSWYIHHDQMDGCSSNITIEILDSCKELLQDLFEEIEIGYVKPNDIIFDPIKSLGTNFNKEIVKKLEEELIGEIYDDEEEYHDYDDGEE